MTVRLFRLLVGLTLALAIPLQGVAAMTAGVCMSLGHHAGAAPAQHDHAANHEHDGDHGAPHGDNDDSAHCAPCVACCAAASIAPAVPVFLLQNLPAAAVAAVPYLHPGFLPKQLDRPPLAL